MKVTSVFPKTPTIHYIHPPIHAFPQVLKEEKSFVHLAFEYLPTQYVYHPPPQTPLADLNVDVFLEDFPKCSEELSR